MSLSNDQTINNLKYPDMNHHPLAFVNPGAKLGENVTVEPFAYIDDNVEIGDGTYVGPHAVILSGARIGKDCRIFSGAVVSGIPQDLKFNGEESTTIVGDRTTIRECVTISRGTEAKGVTKVGSDCLLMAYVHVAHDCVVGDHVILVNSVNIAGEVEVGDWAILGGTAAVHQFVHIGKHAMVSGGSLIRKDVPPFVKAAREPLAYVGINTIGLRRRGFSNEKINEIHDMYRAIYQSNMNNSQALEYIEMNFPASEERDEIVEFVTSSKRGIMKGYDGE
jgi:UDP-N-acetylglucosamine acyltransferase